MNNIDDRLRRSRTVTPQRPLTPTFTDATMASVYAAQAKKPQSLFAWLASGLQGFTHMYKLTKPAALAVTLGVLSLMAGTSYATLKWLQPNATVDKNSITTLPNGNTRVWIHNDNCQGQDMEYPIDSYYEIKAGSNVTPEDLRKGLEAGCEDSLLMPLFPEIHQYTKGKMPADFKLGDRQYHTPILAVKAIDKDGITVASRINGRDYPQTKLPFDKDARFYQKGQKMDLQDVQPGDWVTLVSYTTSLDKPFATESLHPDELEKLMENGFPKGARVAGLIRHQYNPENFQHLMGVMGEDWTRLVEDKNAPDGWRQLIPFDHDWQKYQESYQKQ